MTVVEELVSVLGLEIGEGALATLSQFKTAVTQGLAGIEGVVAALGAAFAGTVVSVAELGIESQQAALKLGVTTESIQELRYAADMSNVSFTTLQTGLRFLSKNAAEAAAGTGELSQYFKGIPLHDTNGKLKTADELLFSLVDRFNEIKDPIKQTDLAVRLLGRGGAEMIPMLKQNKAGLEKLISEAWDLGYVLDDKTILASNRFNVSLKHLKNSLLGLRNTVGSPFIDDFSDALDWMTERVKRSRGWFQSLTKDIRELGQRLAKIIDVGKKAFESISQFMNALGVDKITSAIDWVHLLEAAIEGVAVIAVTSAVSTAASWLIAAAPFILIATLIGLIVDDIAHFVKGQDSVLGRADLWAKRFDENDAPEIKFFKSLTALLLDLGSPDKWARVGKSAKDGFFPFVQWLQEVRNGTLKPLFDLLDGSSHLTDSLGDSIQKKIELSMAKTPEDVSKINNKYDFLEAFRNKDQKGMDAAKNNMRWDAGREKNRQPFDVSPKEIGDMSEKQWAAYVKRSNTDQQWQKGKGAEITGTFANMSTEDLGHWANSVDRNGNHKTISEAALPPLMQNIEVHVTASMTPDQARQVVVDAVNQANSDAKAALNRGS